MGGLKKVLKNAGLYTIVQIIQGVVSFLMLPIYTKYLSPTDYGIVSVVTSVINFLGIFYILGLHGALVKYYVYYEDDKEKQNELVSTIIITVFIIAGTFTGLFILLHKVLLEKFLNGIDFYPYLFYSLISIFFSSIYICYQALLQIRAKGNKYSIIQLCIVFGTLILNIIFIIVFKFQAMGMILSGLIINILVFIYAIISLNKEFTISFNKEILRKSLKYSLPLLPHSLANWTSNLVDRILLNNLLSAKFVGIYNVGYQFGNIINIVALAVNNAFIPWFFSEMKGENDRSALKKFAIVFIMIYSIGAMWLSILAPIVLKIMVNEKYMAAVTCIPYIAFAYVYNGIYYFFVSGLFYNERGTKYIFLGSMTGAVINIILNYVLIPRYEIVGSSIATLVSFITTSILVLIISIRINRGDNLRWDYKRLYLIATSAMILTIVSLRIFDNNIIMKFVTCIISTVIIFLISGIKANDVIKIIGSKFKK